VTKSLRAARLTGHRNVTAAREDRARRPRARVATSSPTDRAKMKSMTSAVWRLACPDEYETDAVRHALRRSAMPSYVFRPNGEPLPEPDRVQLNLAVRCG